MKKTFLLSAVSVLSLIASTGFAQAAATPSATGNISAEIVSVITIQNATDMSFGSLIGEAGTAKLDAATGKISGATVANKTTAQAGEFTIKGTEGTKFSVSAGDTEITRQTGSETMAVNNFNFSYNGKTQDFALVNDGSQNTTKLKVGADLTIAGEQKAGTYKGTYTVTVSY